MEKRDEGDLVIVTFEIGDALIGIDSSIVEEIVRVPPITPVRGSDEYVLGIVNLRGRIITIVDISVRLGLGAVEIDDGTRILVTTVRGEAIGAIVSHLSDVIETTHSTVQRLAGHLKGANEEYFVGIFENAGRLIALLDPTKALGAPG